MQRSSRGHTMRSKGRTYQQMGGRMPGWHVRNVSLQMIAALLDSHSDIEVWVEMRPTAMQFPCHDDYPLEAHDGE
jgi:hypothetical protein